MADKEKDQKKLESEEQTKLPQSEDKLKSSAGKEDYLRSQTPLRDAFKDSALMTLDVFGIISRPDSTNSSIQTDFIEKEMKKIYKEAREVAYRQTQEEKELNLRKERAIVDLMEKAEEVEIEEMGDTNNAFNIGGTVGQTGIGGNLGKENGVSHYRRYKFKRGAQTSEIENSSEGKPEEY